VDKQIWTRVPLSHVLGAFRDHCEGWLIGLMFVWLMLVEGREGPEGRKQGILCSRLVCLFSFWLSRWTKVKKEHCITVDFLCIDFDIKFLLKSYIVKPYGLTDIFILCLYCSNIRFIPGRLLRSEVILTFEEDNATATSFGAVVRTLC
jgi:hypothetical protein